MQGRNLPRVSRRSAVTAAVVAPIAAWLTPSPVKADLIGDVGVLIAQLEQQLQLVSNAIATVQNLVQTVQHLSNVVQNGKQLLKRVSAGDIEGVLSAAQGFVGLARGVTGSLGRLDRDARWWDTNVRRLIVTEQLTPSDTQRFKSALAEMDQRRLQNANQTSESFAHVKNAYDAVENSSAAVKRGLSTEGVVGQMQLANVESANLAIIGATQVEMTAMLARRNEEELTRLAAIREHNRQLTEGALKGLGDTNTATPASLPFDTQNGWNSDGSSGAAQGFIQ